MSSFTHFYALFVFLTQIYCFHFQLFDRIKLSNIEKFNFHRGSYTNARRFKSSPKLECFSSALLCSDFQIDTAECFNRDNKWTCKSPFPYGIEFGYLQVICEGYESDSDEFILADSCKLKYSLERSLKAKSFGVNIQDHTESAISTPTIIGVVISLLSMVFIIVGKILCCKNSEKVETKINYKPQKNEPDLAPPAAVQLPVQPDSLPVGVIQNLKTGLVDMNVIDLSKTEQNLQTPKRPPSSTPISSNQDSINDLHQTIDPAKKMVPRVPPPPPPQVKNTNQPVIADLPVPGLNLKQRPPPAPPTILSHENNLNPIVSAEPRANDLHTIQSTFDTQNQINNAQSDFNLDFENKENENSALIDSMNFSNLENNLDYSVIIQDKLNEINQEIPEINSTNEFSMFNNADSTVLPVLEIQNTGYGSDFLNNLLSNSTTNNVDSIESFQVLPSISDFFGNIDSSKPVYDNIQPPLTETKLAHESDSEILEKQNLLSVNAVNSNSTEILQTYDQNLLQPPTTEFDLNSFSIHQNPPSMELNDDKFIMDLTESLINPSNTSNGGHSLDASSIYINPVQQDPTENQLDSYDFFSNLLSGTSNIDTSNSFPLPSSIQFPNNDGKFDLKDIQGDYIEVSLNNNNINQEATSIEPNSITNNESMNFSLFDLTSSISQNTESQSLGEDFLTNFLSNSAQPASTNEINNGFNNVEASDFLTSFLSSELPASNNNNSDFSLID